MHGRNCTPAAHDALVRRSNNVWMIADNGDSSWAPRRETMMALGRASEHVGAATAPQVDIVKVGVYSVWHASV